MLLDAENLKYNFKIKVDLNMQLNEPKCICTYILVSKIINFISTETEVIYLGIKSQLNHRFN